MDSGMGPLNLFSFKNKVCKLVNCPMVSGMGPVN